MLSLKGLRRTEWNVKGNVERKEELFSKCKFLKRKEEFCTLRSFSSSSLLFHSRTSFKYNKNAMNGMMTKRGIFGKKESIEEQRERIIKEELEKFNDLKGKNLKEEEKEEYLFKWEEKIEKVKEEIKELKLKAEYDAFESLTEEERLKEIAEIERMIDEKEALLPRVPMTGNRAIYPVLKSLQKRKKQAFHYKDLLESGQLDGNMHPSFLDIPLEPLPLTQKERILNEIYEAQKKQEKWKEIHGEDSICPGVDQVLLPKIEGSRITNASAHDLLAVNRFKDEQQLKFANEFWAHKLSILPREKNENWDKNLMAFWFKFNRNPNPAEVAVIYNETFPEWVKLHTYTPILPKEVVQAQKKQEEKDKLNKQKKEREEKEREEREKEEEEEIEEEEEEAAEEEEEVQTKEENNVEKQGIEGENQEDPTLTEANGEKKVAPKPKKEKTAWELLPKKERRRREKADRKLKEQMKPWMELLEKNMELEKQELEELPESFKGMGVTAINLDSDLAMHMDDDIYYSETQKKVLRRALIEKQMEYDISIVPHRHPIVGNVDVNDQDLEPVKKEILERANKIAAGEEGKVEYEHLLSEDIPEGEEVFHNPIDLMSKEDYAERRKNVSISDDDQMTLPFFKPLDNRQTLRKSIYQDIEVLKQRMDQLILGGIFTMDEKYEKYVEIINFLRRRRVEQLKTFQFKKNDPNPFIARWLKLNTSEEGLLAAKISGRISELVSMKALTVGYNPGEVPTPLEREAIRHKGGWKFLMRRTNRTARETPAREQNVSHVWGRTKVYNWIWIFWYLFWFVIIGNYYYKPYRRDLHEDLDSQNETLIADYFWLNLIRPMVRDNPRIQAACGFSERPELFGADSLRFHQYRKFWHLDSFSFVFSIVGVNENSVRISFAIKYLGNRKWKIVDCHADILSSGDRIPFPIPDDKKMVSYDHDVKKDVIIALPYDIDRFDYYTDYRPLAYSYRRDTLPYESNTEKLQLGDFNEDDRDISDDDDDEEALEILYGDDDERRAASTVRERSKEL
eukprot:TRINITY_DN2428_c0_g1_i3.p1 TRINITY_DN2428_c0_g1~~TRINITY_DN2428_c0_g1_i3.p1  ORF type:complete len:1023 (-),score=401.82 TRINITY_DN2428_c0_g1_i3:76-3144(-)